MSAATAALAAAVILLAALLRRSQRERQRLLERVEAASQSLSALETSFARFAPASVVEQIAAGSTPTGGERKEVTVLFADLVGYTALSESLEPDALVHILNGYFGFMSEAITRHRGRVSTFIGDGVLALYGAFEPNPWQADDATHTALEIRESLAKYNETLRAEGLPSLAVGVGIHRGFGVAGLVGSRDLMEFAVVGPTVNLAARVQDLTRALDVDIILTDAVAKTIDPRFALRALPPSEVKGVAQAIVIHGVDGFDGA